MTVLKPQSVLCPIDLSPISDGVLRWAGLFARAFATRVEALYANWWEPPRYFTEAQIQDLSRQERESEKRLRAELVDLARAALTDVAPYNVTLVEGHPTQRILERAEELMAGLIVMGSHGRSGMARLRLGSVAEDVIRASVCPFSIVKSVKDPGRLPTVENILCPVNFTSVSHQCLELSSELASAFGAKLWVVHAADEDAGNLQEIHQRICDWVPQEVRGRCELSEVVRQGNAAEQIVLMGRERSADLIVMGAQHPQFLEFTMLGATTEKVMRHSLASVLVVPMRQSETDD